VQEFSSVTNEGAKLPMRLLPAVTLARARSLRRDQTDAERKLWRLLHNRRLAAPNFVATTLSANFLPTSAASRRG
jgi:very-short-patch-repair endonuclease